MQCKDNPNRKCACGKEKPVHEDSFHLKLTRDIAKANRRMVGGSKYKDMKMEPWDEMEATETKEDFLIYLRIAAKKHQLRLGKKEGTTILEDMEKAHHILEKWIEVYKS